MSIVLSSHYSTRWLTSGLLERQTAYQNSNNTLNVQIFSNITFTHTQLQEVVIKLQNHCIILVL